jgi:hypothetical protein
MIFLRYHEGSKGYKFWDHKKRTMVHSCDAAFKEFNFPARQWSRDTVHPSMEEKEEIIMERDTKEQKEAMGLSESENTHIPISRLENFPN